MSDEMTDEEKKTTGEGMPETDEMGGEAEQSE